MSLSFKTKQYVSGLIIMIILTTTASAQEVKIVPRNLVANSVEITDESTNVTTTHAITPSVDRYFLVFNLTLSLLEGGKYTIKVFDGVTEVYLGSIFCTDQAVDNYTINKNTYTENPTNNEFIIL